MIGLIFIIIGTVGIVFMETLLQKSFPNCTDELLPSYEELKVMITEKMDDNGIKDYIKLKRIYSSYRLAEGTFVLISLIGIVFLSIG